jgi:hypothetical protein
MTKNAVANIGSFCHSGAERRNPCRSLPIRWKRRVRFLRYRYEMTKSVVKVP